ncbi:MAG: nitronate monooxygenase [Deltaproteobacteria bacterium]|nr:nitronate monooxygenase [Deltaproteobacteria bacterium]MBW2051604.1 nitronate monooxygenase [Deltaproteobacteria bacterium]MBW2140155.1 nitronate monooxygenase [Deltaproteobacteria bacterium]MBW2322926.1 nitronate monooxygenase [Deltaproteobacteria bacterium]
MSNVICEALGIRYPIILGGLARVGTASLAAAVSNAGGLGLLGAGSWNGVELRDQIRRARELTGQPFGVNVPVRSDYAEELIETVIAEGIKAVATSAGNPRRFTSRLQEHNIFVMHVVPTSSYAVVAEEAGVNAVVAEGVESGGMTSLEEISTFVLVPQVVDAVKCPVIAAGGIGDGRGLAAALALGAVGVQMGTAFMATEECEISRAFKEMMVRAVETDTRLFRRDRSSRRTFKEDFFQAALKDWPNLLSDLKRDPDASFRGAGQVAGLVSEIQPVKEIIERMIREAREILPGISEKLS